MKISIAGNGYVGAVTGACFAKLGHYIIFIDVDKKRIDLINKAISPVCEKGLDELLSNYKDKIKATNDYSSAIKESDIIFICVGTPSKSDGHIDLSFIEDAAIELGKCLKNKDGWHLVVVKSTVLPGTAENVILPLIEKHSGKKAGKDFGLATNPEFLKEGVAVKDFLEPDRIVFGFYDEKSRDVLRELYKNFSCPIVETSLSTAEMIKYVNNAFLATKISFANEIGNICKKLGINTYEVFHAVGLDNRINPAFFGAGIGFGGSCFPKDVRALIAKGDEIESNARMLKSAMEVNEEQPIKLIQLLKKHIPSLKGKKIGVLGLSFKPNTDDIRESRAIPIVDILIKNGADVIAYDPLAEDNFKKLFSQIEYAPSCKEILNSDAILIVTDWEEFNNLDYKGKIVIDGRKIEKAKKEAAVYEGVCW